MAAEEKDEVTALCNRVIEEQDPAKFHELVVQLNELLKRSRRGGRACVRHEFVAG